MLSSLGIERPVSENSLQEKSASTSREGRPDAALTCSERPFAGRIRIPEGGRPSRVRGGA